MSKKSDPRHQLSTTLECMNMPLEIPAKTPWHDESTDLARNPWTRRIAAALIISQLFQLGAVLPAYAQSDLPTTPHSGAPAGQRPMMDAANNGAPIVLIAPPSTAGVSRNQYDQFNVNQNGLILNNSNGNASTQLGGWIAGNPQLGVMPARIILNEVVSGNPSQLRGTIEVAGGRADIVLANPNGITCSGCGFLNADRASLTTGMPQFGAGGALSGFDVRQGQIAIGERGLNAANLEQLDLIARGLVIEGEVWAKNLNAIAGSNQVLYGTLQATSQSGSGAEPAFAIDIKNLGGMYANQIYMVATENGLGVNSTGRLAALQGNLVLDAKGNLTLQDAYAKGEVRLAAAGNTQLNGQIAADGKAIVNSGGQLVNAGELNIQGQLAVNVANLVNIGQIAQYSGAGAQLSIGGTLSNSGAIHSGGQLDVNAASLADTAGRLQSTANLHVQAGQISLLGTNINSGGNVRLQAAAGSLASSNAAIYADGTITTIAQNALSNLGGTWQARQNIALQSATMNNTGGEILASGALTSDTGALQNTQGTMIGNAATTIHSDALDNSEGTIATNGALSINTRTGDLSNQKGQIVAGKEAVLASGVLDNTNGTIASLTGDLNVTTNGRQWLNDGGKIQAFGNASVASGNASNQSGIISGIALDLDSGAFDNRGGQVVSGGKLAVKTTSLNNSSGLIQAVEDITLDTRNEALVNTASGAAGGIIAGKKLAIAAGSLNNQAGYIASNGDQILTLSGELDNSMGQSQPGQGGGQIIGNAHGAITAANIRNAGGQIKVVGNLTATATGTLEAPQGVIDNRAGQIAANRDMTLSATTIQNSAVNGVGGAIDGNKVVLSSAALDNAGGFIRATESANFAITDLNNNSGLISSRQNLMAKTSALSNANGKIEGADTVKLATASSNFGGTIASGNTLELAVEGNYLNSGLVSAQQSLTVNADNIENRGTLTAGGTLTATTGNLTNSGEISAKVTHLNVANTLTNSGTGLIDGETTSVNATTTNNTGRIYGDMLRIRGVALNNSGTGVIAARENLLIGSQSVSNTDGGLIYSVKDLSIAGGFDSNNNLAGEVQQLTNASSRIEAGNTLSISAKSLLNRNDGLVTRIATSTQAINKTYIQPNGSATKYDVAVLGWDPHFKKDSGRYVIPSASYPFSQFGTIKFPLSKRTVCTGGSDSGRECVVVHLYDSSHGIWAVFNIAPADLSDLTVPLQPGGNTCTRERDNEIRRDMVGDCGTYWNAVDEYTQVSAVRRNDAENALDAKIESFNGDVENRSFEAWNEYHISSRELAETVVDATRPGQILAGGTLTISGSGAKTNDNSQIIAGGPLAISGGSLENRSTQGMRSETEVGQVRFRRIEHHGGFSNSYEVELHPWHATTGAPQVSSFNLPTVVYQANAGNQTLTRNLSAALTNPAVNLTNAVAPLSSQALSTGAKAINAVLSGAASNQLAGQTLLPILTAPTSSLFAIRNQPGALYLVETDPRFTSRRNFLSSDYYLNQLNRDPERQLKRYGDGFFEQQLVNDQIMALTGRRYLSGYSNTEQEFQDLMDAGVVFARQYQISPGVSLSAEQMALLTTDVVMLTEQTVTLADGSTRQVLVPQVYLRRPQSGDLQTGGSLIAGSDILIQTDTQLVNSGRIAADNQNTLLAGTDLVNEGGRISGQDIYLRANNDLKNISGTIQGQGAGSQVALMAGRDVILETRTIASQSLASGTTAASQRINVDRIATIQGGTVNIGAGRDLVGKGSTVRADYDLIATAGRDIRVSAVEGGYRMAVATGGNTQGRTGYIKEESVVNQLASFNAGNSLAMVAGTAGKGDIVLKGVDVAAGDNALIKGSNVTIEAVKDRQFVDVQNVRRRGYDRAMVDDEILAGANVSAGNNLTVIAAGTPGNANEGNVRLAGAYLAADKGQAAIVASNNVELDVLTTEHRSANEHYSKNKGMLGSTTIQSAQFTNREQANGSAISGNSVVIQAGNAADRTGDITIRASQVVGERDVQIAAGNNLTIATAQEHADSKSIYTKKTSGLFSDGGLSFTIGTQKMDQDGEGKSVTHVGSAVGSLQGDVTLTAGKNYTQSASQVVATQGSVAIAAQNVDINAAIDSAADKSEQRFRQSGLTVALTAPVIEAVQSVQQMSEAVSATKDKRLQALGVITAGAQLASAANAAADAAADAAAKGSAGISVSISYGESKSENKQEQASTAAIGSAIRAGKDISIEASGAGQGSNIAITGSDIVAGNNVSLKADNDITLQAAQSTFEQHSTSKSDSASVGVAFNFGANGVGVGVTASASQGRGNADGKDVAHSNTHVAAGNFLSIESGGDTSLKGAVVSGKEVIARIGGDLNIESLQDTSVYKSKDQNFGGNVMVGVGFSASVSASKGKVDAEFASVTEQSGIQAGDGGFNIIVKGNTDLKGGAIASTDKAIADNKNSFTTTSLTHSDIANYSHASAKSIGINLSSDMLTQGTYGVAKGVIGSALNNAGESGNSSGQTRSAVSVGTVTIIDEGKQQQLTGKTAEEMIVSLNRDTTDTHTAAQKQDAQAMKQTVEAERAIKQAALKQVTLVTDAVYRSATGPKKIMLLKCDGQGQSCDPVAVDMKNHRIAAGLDGKVYIFNHGIMNTEESALDNAAKQSSTQALAQGVYVVINPHTGNVIAEVVYAAWDKTMAPIFGISNAAEANIDLVNAARDQGAVSVDISGHSRGGITIENFTSQMRTDGVTNSPITHIQLNGSAGNAQKVQVNLNQITQGQGQVHQSTHQNDFVSTVIGNNPPTGGLPSSFGDAHTNYGPNADPMLTKDVWGPGLISPSLPANLER